MSNFEMYNGPKLKINRTSKQNIYKDNKKY